MNKNILHCVIVYYKLSQDPVAVSKSQVHLMIQKLVEPSLAIGQLKVGLTFDARMLRYTEEFSSVTARCSVPVGAK